MSPASIPIFRQLARTLSEAIESGAVAVGDLLPTEHELARRHGVSRHTVREALSDLRARGLIESKQGIGSVVVRRDPVSSYSETYSSVEELTRFAQGSPLRASAVDDVIADAGLARELRGRVGQQYLRITGVRHERDREAAPVCHVEVYVDAIYAGIRDEAFSLDIAVAEAIERRYGLTIARIEQEIGVEVLTAEQASVVDAAEGSPAMVIRRWYAADGGRIFESAISRYPMGRFTYRNVLVRSTGG